ncbi:MAG: hypothetical protein P8179_25490 [Candidatus Thiodiazotropha sp.]
MSTKKPEEAQSKMAVIENVGSQEVFEFLENIIIQSQAAGSTVCIVTISPGTIQSGGEEGCRPTALHCPKGC